MTLLDQRATKPGVGYAELQWAEDGMVGFAGGVAVDTRSGRRGPQFTGFVGPLYRFADGAPSRELFVGLRPLARAPRRRRPLARALRRTARPALTCRHRGANG